MNSDQEEVIRLLEAQSVSAAVLKETSAARFYLYPDACCLGDINLLVDQSNLRRVEQVLDFLGYNKIENEHRYGSSSSLRFALDFADAVAYGKACAGTGDRLMPTLRLDSICRKI